MSKRIKVAILGGGIGGLTAAHELAEIGRDFEVHVYEATDDIGGKARSQFVAGTGKQGRMDLPGEHGFRFFPAWYRHIPDTMRRIPMPGGNSVEDNLVGCTEMIMAEAEGKPPVQLRRHRPDTTGELFDMVGTLLLCFEQAVPQSDLARFAIKMLDYLLTCDERRRSLYEDISFFDFIEGHRYSSRFQAYINSSRFMVAMDCRNGSACTIANKVLQLLLDFRRPKGENDRVLNGPTNPQWLDPWKAYLCGCGVTFHLGKEVEALQVDKSQRRIVAARAGGEVIEADYFIAAVPLEKMQSLVGDELSACDESLRRLRKIKKEKMTSFMVGAQYFLRIDVPIFDGHLAFPDSPWALSAIFQASFWDRGKPESERFRNRYGDGSAGGVLSVDISDWNADCPRLRRSAAKCKNAREVLDEVWAQLKDALNGDGRTRLDDANLVERYLDAHVRFTERGAENDAPLLVHPPGSWYDRPRATLAGICNLMLAADYVQTGTDLATMESANEAARHAVNGILRQEGRSETVRVFPMVEDAGPRVAKAKARDRKWWTEKGRAAPLLIRLPIFRDEEGPTLDQVKQYQIELDEAIAALPDDG